MSSLGGRAELAVHSVVVFCGGRSVLLLLRAAPSVRSLWQLLFLQFSLHLPPD